MRKLLLLFVVVFCFLGEGKTQYVTIPDANFRTYLQSKYPSAFNVSGMMDTTNSLIVNETKLYLTAGNVISVNFNGLQYFKNLIELYFDGNFYGTSYLIQSSWFPKNLKRLSVLNCGLSSLPTLPSSLTFLDCSNNNLTALPTLPSTLDTLECFNNLISFLTTLPSNLKKINCSGNKLMTLPALPINLRELFCGNNLLSSLPNLPNSLFELFCPNNKLTTLPILKSLAALNNVYCSDNLLTEIPEFYFDDPSGGGTLVSLDCSNNINIKCLPELPNSVGSLFINGTSITCLKNKPMLLFTTLPICVPNNPNNCPTNYVNIPDTNFGKFLIAQYPTCLYKDASNMYWMDTTCGAVVNETNLDCNSALIKNLTGVKYFKNISGLNVYNNNIVQIPELPSNVEDVNFNKNQIVNVNNIPNSVLTLRLQENSITAINSLPPNIQNLELNNNPLNSIPSSIPASLNNLYVYATNLNCLPYIDRNCFCLLNIFMDTNKIRCLDYVGNVDVSPSLGIFLSNYNKCAVYNPNNCPTFGTTANYVNIPDTNFGKFLITQYPGCLYKDASNMYWMDTTCGAVVNELYLGTGNKNIKDITGIKYFTNLLRFNCDSNLLVSIAELPKKLIHFSANYNKLVTVSNLPDSLGELFIMNNQVTGITSFPSKLGWLYAQNNLLTSLPALPTKLRWLYCSGNQLTSLPTLPASVTDIDCSKNQLTNIPSLPANLSLLVCDSNQLTSLPQLSHLAQYNAANGPSNFHLSCLGNNITCLPELPAGPIIDFSRLVIDTSKIKCLPNSPQLMDYNYNIVGSLGVKNSFQGNAFPYPVCNSSYNPNNCFFTNTYVNIPDTNFGKFLITQYPACLYKDASNMYWMDTTCGAVVNATILNTNNFYVPNIINVDGLQYFKNLDDLVLNNLDVYTLPKITNTLRYLHIANLKNLSVINQLPNNLIRFGFYNVPISTLPNLPLSLIDLGNKTSSSSIPSWDYDGLSLPCHLKTLPSLPDGLHFLYIYSDSLKTLPTLPNSLYQMYIKSPLFYNLPTYIPDSITTIGLFTCPITCLPDLYNKTLLLNQDSTKIRCLPNNRTFLRSSTNNLFSSFSLPICNPTNNPNQCQIYPSVSGKVYTDNNSNATKEANEFYRPFVKLQIQNGQTTYSGLYGSYGFTVDTFGTYTLKVIAPANYKAVPDSVSVTFSPGSSSLVLPDIALQPINSVDSFAIKITSINQPRPGFSYSCNVSFGNVGTVSSTVNNIVKVVIDTNKLVFDSVSNHVQSATTFNNATQTITTNAGQMVAGQSGSFNIYCHVKTTVPLGSLVKSNATITYSATQVTKAYDTDSAIVIGSYDPNDKLATPSLTPTQVVTGTPIDYTIRFQNTGTASAINVVISDTLSNLLQYNQIQVVATSHNSKISYRLGNGIIYFEFFGINLPDSNANEALSHGFVRFSIKPLNTLAVGAVVENKAHIYFDYNSPIITNTAQTVIKSIVLPVRLINYTASPTPPKEGLTNWSINNTWSVGVENNLSHYGVERSNDGKEFIEVGKVNAIGSSTYAYNDKLSMVNSQQLTVFYRLKMVDKDGKFAYSEIKRVTINDKQQTVKLYPNPSKGNVSIEVASVKEIQVLDVLGKTVYKSTVNSQQSKVKILQLNKGVYMVKAIMNSGEVKVEKLIVE